MSLYLAALSFEGFVAVSLRSLHDSVTPSECGGNQISVVIDMASEVMLLLPRLYKGCEGNCHSGMASGAARKLLAGNLMHLKPSYTHSIYPQHDLGTQGYKLRGGEHSGDLILIQDDIGYVSYLTHLYYCFS